MANPVPEAIASIEAGRDLLICTPFMDGFERKVNEANARALLTKGLITLLNEAKEYKELGYWNLIRETHQKMVQNITTAIGLLDRCLACPRQLLEDYRSRLNSLM